MEDNYILLYSLSTIPQVLAATSAIMVIFVQYRFGKLTDILIGDGKAALERFNDYIRDLEKRKAERLQKRLRDSVFRKNIYGVQDVLNQLTNIEAKHIKQGKVKKEDVPTGLSRHVYPKFIKTLDKYQNIKKWTISTIAFSLLTMIISILFLITLETLPNNICSIYTSIVILSITCGLFIISLISSYILLRKGLSENTLHEKEKINNVRKRDKRLRKNLSDLGITINK